MPEVQEETALAARRLLSAALKKSKSKYRGIIISSFFRDRAESCGDNGHARLRDFQQQQHVALFFRPPAVGYYWSNQKHINLPQAGGSEKDALSTFDALLLVSNTAFIESSSAPSLASSTTKRTFAGNCRSDFCVLELRTSRCSRVGSMCGVGTRNAVCSRNALHGNR